MDERVNQNLSAIKRPVEWFEGFVIGSPEETVWLGLINEFVIPLWTWGRSVSPLNVRTPAR